MNAGYLGNDGIEKEEVFPLLKISGFVNIFSIINDITKEDIVKLVNFEGEDYLFYPSFPINVAFIRGTYADENGNITLEKKLHH